MVEVGDAFWFQARWLQVYWLLLGSPCFGLMLYSLLSLLGCRFCLPKTEGEGSRKPVSSAATLPSAYGVLLDVSDMQVDVDRSVNRWVTLGATAAILYALTLVLLALTTIGHAEDFDMNAVDMKVDSMESFIMSVCKLMVGYCAHKVHRHLSEVSSAVAGFWILALAISKYLMGICFFLLSVGYAVYTLLKDVEHGGRPQDNDNYGSNFVVLLFVMAIPIGIIFQASAGFALFRIQQRAEAAGGPGVFSNVVGCWWAMLVSSTYIVGAALWLCPAPLIMPMDVDFFAWLGSSFLLSGICQVCAGLAMLRINQLVKAYFLSAEGKRTLGQVRDMAVKGMEMADSVGAPSLML